MTEARTAFTSRTKPYNIDAHISLVELTRRVPGNQAYTIALTEGSDGYERRLERAGAHFKARPFRLACYHSGKGLPCGFIGDGGTLVERIEDAAVFPNADAAAAAHDELQGFTVSYVNLLWARDVDRGDGFPRT